MALLQTGLHALAKQTSLPEGEANGLMALPGHMASLAEEVASLAEEMAQAQAEAQAEEQAAAMEEVVAEQEPEAAEEEDALPVHVAELVLDGHVILATPEAAAPEEKPEAAVMNTPEAAALEEPEAAVLEEPEAAAVEEPEAAAVETREVAALEEPEATAVEEPEQQLQLNHIVSIEHAVSAGQRDAIEQLTGNSEQAGDGEPVEAASSSAPAPPQYSFWEQQHTDGE